MVNLLPRLPGENNNNYAYRAIKEGIISLELQPGQLLSVSELTDALKVSSTPIKTALWKLQQEHLVDVIPQVGSYVAKVNLELVEEAAYMWFNIEKETLKLACDVFPKNNLNQLKSNLHLQELLLDEKTVFLNQKEWLRKLHELDDQFHAIIFQAHNRNNTWKVISQMTSNYHRMINLTQSEHSFEHVIAGHKDILSIIEKKEIERVESVLRNHILKPIYDWKNEYVLQYQAFDKVNCT